MVFNPAGGPRTDLVSLEIVLPAGLDTDHPDHSFEIVDESENILPHQVLDTDVHEIFNMPLDREGLRSALSMVQDGRVENMFIREVGFRRDGGTLFIDLVMADEQPPEPETLRQGLAAIEKWLEEETVTTFVARARSAAVARLQLAAHGVPEHGYRTFWLRPASGAPRNPTNHELPEGVIENEFLKAEISPTDGTLRLEDKRTGMVFPGLNRFVDGGDCGDEYNYAPPALDQVIAQAEVVSIATHHNPACQTMDVSLVMQVPEELGPNRQGRSSNLVRLPIMVQISLVPGLPRLDIHSIVDNGPAGGPARARDHRLRVHFLAPFAGQAIPEAVSDGHFELARRPATLAAHDTSWSEPPRPEQPQRAFTGVSYGDYGMVIANRGLPEVEILSGQGNGHPGCEIALTLMRSVGWLSRGDFVTRKGNAGPMLATPGAQMAGTHTFEYSVIPHTVGPQDALSLLAYWHAYAFNAPMRAVAAGLHTGSLSSQASLASISPQAFIPSAMKMAEDGRGWLVRGYNLTAEPVQVTIIPYQPFQSAYRVNLAEEIEEALTTAQDGSISFSAAGHQIVTVKFSV